MENDELFIFSLDGENTSPMTEQESKMFKRELERNGVMFELKSIGKLEGISHKFKNIEGLIDNLVSENFEMKRRFDCLENNNKGESKTKHKIKLHVNELSYPFDGRRHLVLATNDKDLCEYIGKTIRPNEVTTIELEWEK